ncbi:MAG: hypothetical protein ACUVTU_00005 [Desulfurispora sp.]|uniref:hypothetical protein n=1 Tax=Desulfurispora sp. TaxID=3014275 RepID=UPI00404A10F6
MIATKEQERKTLEKIKQMVTELGENSYLAAAFTGAFELAEQNIENDWGITTQEYIDRAIKDDENENRAKKELATVKTELEGVQSAHRGTTKALEETSERAQRYAYEIDSLKEAMKAAKLYDYMTAAS